MSLRHASPDWAFIIGADDDVGGIAELLYDNTNDSWSSNRRLDQTADNLSGVGCTSQVESNASHVDIYYRNTTTTFIQQKWWDFGPDPSSAWTNGMSND